MIPLRSRVLPNSRRRIRPATMTIAALSVAALMLGACSSSGGAGSPSQPAGSTPAGAGNGGAGASGASSGATCSHMDKVTFLNILPLTSLSYTPLMVADTGGYFKKQCLDPSFQTTKGSAQAIQTVIAGKALLAWVGVAETMVDNAKGAPVVTVAVKSPNTERFVSSSKAPLKTASDFKGKLIGLPSAGGTSQTILTLILNAAGLKLSDAKTQVVGLAPGVFSLVESGRIAAYAVSLDTAVLLKAQRPNAVIYDPSSDITAANINFITSTAQSKDPKKADEIRRFLKAIYNAEKFIISDQKNDFKKTIEMISSKYDVPTLENKDIRVNVLKNYAKSYTFHGADNMLRVVPKSWKQAYQEVVHAGLVKGGLNPNEWYTNKFSPSPGS